MKLGFINKKVINHFITASKIYSKRESFAHEENLKILNFIKEACTTNLKILEVDCI